MLKIISWLLLTLASGGGLTAYFLQQQYEEKSADFRILYREVTIKLSQHDAIIPLLSATRYDGEIHHIFPQIIRWRPHLAFEPRRAIVAESNGRYWLNAANQSLLIDLNVLIKEVAESMPFHSVQLRWNQQPLFEQGGGPQPYYWQWEKVIASESQPFELVAGDNPNWQALPWLKILAPAFFWGLVLYLFTQYRHNRRQRDIADLRAHYNELTRLNTLGELAAGIMHELNQPLTAILSYNQTALRLIQPPHHPQLPALLDAAVVQTKRIDALLKQFRQNLASEQAQFQPVALGPLWIRVTQLLDNEIRRNKVKIISHIPESLPVFSAPPLWVEQILHNMLSNAIEAQEGNMPGASWVKLGAKVKGNGIAFHLSDGGPGLSADALQHVFMPFFTTHAKGIGLGMALTETLVQRLNGTIEVSNILGQGACFSLWLPLHPQEVP